MWTDRIFKVQKPIIALLHIRPLVGDPDFDPDKGMDNVIAMASEELEALQCGGVDGILIANEFSIPYQKKVDYATVAALGFIIGALKNKIRVPFGVNIVSNSIATIDLAAAVGAQFARNAFTGAYLGENGLVDTNVGEAVRRKYALGVPNIGMLYKVNPESDAYLVQRDIKRITKSIVFHCKPDALCVSGASAGSEADDELLHSVKEVAGDTSVLCNTGCNINNIVQKLGIVDGACVGTAFKKDGKFNNYVELKRVENFMSKVKEYRSKIF